MFFTVLPSWSNILRICRHKDIWYMMYACYCRKLDFLMSWRNILRICSHTQICSITSAHGWFAMPWKCWIVPMSLRKELTSTSHALDDYCPRILTWIAVRTTHAQGKQWFGTRNGGLPCVQTLLGREIVDNYCCRRSQFPLAVTDSEIMSKSRKRSFSMSFLTSMSEGNKKRSFSWASSGSML